MSQIDVGEILHYVVASMAVPQLPIEIWEKIIYELANAQTKATRATDMMRDIYVAAVAGGYLLELFEHETWMVRHHWGRRSLLDREYP